MRHGKRPYGRTAVLVVALATGCGADGTGEGVPGASGSRRTAAAGTRGTEPHALTVPIALTPGGQYNLEGPAGSVSATVRVPRQAETAAPADATAALTSLAPVLPDTLSPVSPAVHVTTSQPGLAPPATLELVLDSDAPADPELLWALSVSKGGVRRMPLAVHTDKDGVHWGQLSAVEPGIYGVVRAAAPSRCEPGAIRASGDVVVDTALPADQLEQALGCLVEVSGDLVLRLATGPGSAREVPFLRSLTLLGGSLRIEGAGSLERLSLPALYVTTGSMALTQVHTAELPHVSHVGGGLGVGAGVEEMHAPELGVVVESFALVHSDLRELSGLPRLRAIGGSLGLVGNAELRSVGDLASLTHLGGQLTVAQNPRLERVSLRQLLRLGEPRDVQAQGLERYSVWIQDNPLLSVLDMPALSEVSGEVQLEASNLATPPRAFGMTR